MEPDEFRTVYRSRTHALHLYLYAASVRIGEQRFRLRRGDVTISPAGASSSYRLAESARHWCVHFQPANVRGPAVDLPLHLRLGTRQAYFRNRFQHLVRVHNRPVPRGREAAPQQALASAVLLEMLLELAAHAREEQVRPAARVSDRALVELRDVIEANLAEPLSVSVLARRVGLSQNYLARRFRRSTGTTIKGYVQLRRMEEARHLLENTNLAVKAIAARVGYFDAQYFNKQFRRATGMSPTAFRQQLATEG
jgi:AraC-like DNA-binding protein